MRYTTLLSMFALIVLGFFSCDNDDEMICPEDNDFGDFFLAQSSKDIYPYGDEELVLIFSDSLGNEYRGEYSPRDFTMCNTRSQYPVDPNILDSEQCGFTYRGECRSSLLYFEELDNLEVLFQMHISMNLIEESQERVKSDFFNVILFKDGMQLAGLNELVLGFEGQLAFNTESLKSPDKLSELSLFNLFEEEFDLHDKTYTDVYSSDLVYYGVLDPFDLYYSNEIGLVGFENEDKSISLKFERVE